MNEHHVTEYEDGFFVEKPDYRYPLEECRFIQVAGPYKREASAQKRADALNSHDA